MTPGSTARYFQGLALGVKHQYRDTGTMPPLFLFEELCCYLLQTLLPDTHRVESNQDDA